MAPSAFIPQSSSKYSKEVEDRTGWPTAVKLSRLEPENSSRCSCYQMVSNGWVAASLLQVYEWDTAHSPLINYDEPLPCSFSVKVPLVRQEYSWDCGLACVSMVLRTLGVDRCDVQYLRRFCQTTSIWTIDLAHLLRQFCVDVAFLTITIGANPSLATETFYKDNMEEDGRRVNSLFEKAPQAGIQIQWRSVSGEELSVCILSGRYLAITLVDKRKLSAQPWIEDLCLVECCGLNTGYTGHYIVVCGYDINTDEFEIRDPASTSESHKISLDALDEARKSFGTDEDLLLVSLENSFRESMNILSERFGKL